MSETDVKLADEEGCQRKAGNDRKLYCIRSIRVCDIKLSTVQYNEFSATRAESVCDYDMIYTVQYRSRCLYPMSIIHHTTPSDSLPPRQ